MLAQLCQYGLRLSTLAAIALPSQPHCCARLGVPTFYKEHILLMELRYIAYNRRFINSVV
jgi:hypothetical protein